MHLLIELTIEQGTYNDPSIESNFLIFESKDTSTIHNSNWYENSITMKE